MIKQALKDSTLYSLAAIFSRSIPVLQVPLFSSVLLPADFGIVDLLSALLVMANLVVALEVAQAVAIFYTQAKDNSERVIVASTALWFSVFAYSLFIIIFFPLSSALSGVLLDDASHANLVRIVLCAAAAQGILIIVQNQLRWMLKPKKFFLVNLTNGLLNLSLSVLFVLFLDFGVQGIFWAQLTAIIIAISIAVYYAKGAFAWTFSISRLGSLLRFSIPLVPSSISILFCLYVDRLCIKEILTMTDVGLYSVAYRFASVIGVIVAGASGAVSPLIYSRHLESDTPNQVATLFRMYVLLGLSIVFGLALFSGEILVVFSSPEYYSAHTLLPLLAGSLFIANAYVFTPGLELNKRTVIIASISIGTAIANFILNLYLIPKLGISGAAVATLASSLISFTVWQRLSQSFYKIPFIWEKIILAICFILICIFAVIRFLHFDFTILNLAIKIVILLTAALITARILFSTEELLVLKRKI